MVLDRLELAGGFGVAVDPRHRWEANDFYTVEPSENGFEIWSAYHRYPRSESGPHWATPELVYVRVIAQFPDEELATRVVEVLNAVKEEIWDGGYEAGEEAEQMREYDLPGGG